MKGREGLTQELWVTIPHPQTLREYPTFGMHTQSTPLMGNLSHKATYLKCTLSH